MFLFAVNKLGTNSKDNDYNEGIIKLMHPIRVVGYIVRVLISKYVTAFRGNARWRH